MNIRSTRTSSMKRKAIRLFGPGAIDTMESRGWDFLEADRFGDILRNHAGEDFLDCVSSFGVFNLGRRNATLAQELKEAGSETDQGNFPMISKEKAELGEALADFVPGHLDCAVFAVTRGEALDAACKIARGATERSVLVTEEGGWYGETGFALTLSSRTDKGQFGPLIPDVEILPFEDETLMFQRIEQGDVAAVVVESVQVENHCRRHRREFLRDVETLCRKHGTLFVVDETQTGFGRAGHRFAFMADGLTPDILVLGEALGGGMFPIAATLLTQKVNRFMNKHPMIHLSTFGGSDVGCRVARKALQLYEEQKPWEEARRLGDTLLASFGQFVKEESALAGVSGCGALVSLQLSNTEDALRLCRGLSQRGVLAAPGEVAEDTVVLRPPLTLNEKRTEKLISVVKDALDELMEASR